MSSSMARSLFHCEIFGVATLHSVKLLLRIPYLPAKSRGISPDT